MDDHRTLTKCYNLFMNTIERFIETLNADEIEVIEHLYAFIDWHGKSKQDFTPARGDDVALRTYLLHLKTNGVSSRSRREQAASLRRFYAWAESVGLLTDNNPFAEFNIERPSLTREQIRRRKEIFSGSAEEREIARLTALNELAGQLNRSPDMQTTITAALETLVSLMRLQTGWAFLLPAANSPSLFASVSASNQYSLAGTCGLPPGLKKNDRYHLRNEELCHCQAVMNRGQLTRAVNVVECTRLMHSAQDDGDNQGLLFHATVPIIGSNGPLGIINVATQDWQFLTAADLQLLSAVGAQVAVALERAQLYDVTHAHRQRLERELGLARKVQESLLPNELPRIPRFSLAAKWQSALEMAGDFFDIFQLPDGRWGIVVADVSDKGAPAAMYMVMTRSFIRTSAAKFSGPAKTLEDVNQHLIANSTASMFVTVFYAILDPQSNTLTFSNAGQNPPLLRCATGIDQLARTGMALGIVEGIEMSEVTLSLASCDSLVIYTDGLTEALNTQDEEYGLARLTSALETAPVSNAGTQLDHLMSDLDAFTGDIPPFDDITLFIVTLEQNN
jgi:serine phosphatase RsbU (regulator of sigma subunit)